MKQKIGNYLLFGVVVMSLLLSSACATTSQNANQPTLEPIVYVTQYVTQVVATSLPATLTPVPTFTSQAPQAYSGWDPLAQPIYYPVMGCSASRLHLGDRAFVAFVSGLAGLYQANDISYAPLIRKPVTGEIVEIIDGPWCSNTSVVWKVLVLSDESEAYMPEGDGTEYWLLPMQPITPTSEK